MPSHQFIAPLPGRNQVSMIANMATFGVLNFYSGHLLLILAEFV